MHKPVLFAHRGLSARAPENTLAAFRLAVEAGADGIETDAHLTRDGRIALIHDEKLLRTTGAPGRVAEYTMAELAALDAGSWFDDRFASEGIPELWQLLELVKPTHLQINLELKNGIERYEGLEQAVLAELERFGMLGRIVFSSFNHDSIALVKALEPRAETALLYSHVMHRSADYAKMCGADAIHPHYAAVKPALIGECHGGGIKVRPWTVDDPALAARLAEMGVDALISNCTDELF